MLSTPMTSRRRMPMASSWKLKTTLRRKKSLGSMPSPDYTYRERHGEAIYRFKSLPSRRHRRRQHMMWGSDYPHSESTVPNRVRSWRRSWRACRSTNRPVLDVVQVDHRDALEAGGIRAAEL